MAVIGKNYNLDTLIPQVGVITDIITEPYPTKYEYETWFDSERK